MTSRLRLCLPVRFALVMICLPAPLLRVIVNTPVSGKDGNGVVEMAHEVDLGSLS